MLPALVAALVGGGCAGDDESATQTVTVTRAATVIVTETAVGTTTTALSRPPRLPFPLPPDGTLPVEGFNAYTESIDEPWERNLSNLVDAFVEAGVGDATARSFQATSSDEGASARASLLLDGLRDDSVRSQRYELELSRRVDGTWSVDSAFWAQRCRPGRGHQEFSPEPCV